VFDLRVALRCVYCGACMHPRAFACVHEAALTDQAAAGVLMPPALVVHAIQAVHGAAVLRAVHSAYHLGKSLCVCPSLSVCLLMLTRPP